MAGECEPPILTIKGRRNRKMCYVLFCNIFEMIRLIKDDDHCAVDIFYFIPILLISLFGFWTILFVVFWFFSCVLLILTEKSCVIIVRISFGKMCY